MKLINGDMLIELDKMEENSIDSVVTDNPYGIGFMNKDWDGEIAFKKETWEKVLRVMKPGAHLCAFSSTRCYHHVAMAIEKAGFEIRDTISWIYASGMPKSHNIGKGVDKLRGNKRTETGKIKAPGFAKKEVEMGKQKRSVYEFTKTEGNSEWEGYGTALKPAQELIVLARKPLSEPTIAKNVLKWGTAGLNIDACRIESNDVPSAGKRTKNCHDNKEPISGGNGTTEYSAHNLGRWPSNILLEDDSILGENIRFFFCSKPGKKEKNAGLSEFNDKIIEGSDEGQDKQNSAYKVRPTNTKNIHCTIKPVALMEYLIKLVTPKDGTCLDCFMGSGTTGIAATNLGFDFIGIEKEEEYFDIAEARIEFTKENKTIDIFGE